MIKLKSAITKLKNTVTKIFSKKYRVKTVLVILGLSVLVLIIKNTFFPSPPPPIEVTFDSVKKRTIIELVSGAGKIKPETEIKLAPEVSGEIVSLPVVEGQKVKRGQLLFRVNPAGAKENALQAEAALSSAKAQELQSEARLIQAEDNLGRQKKLYDEKLISEIEYISFKTTFEIEKANYEAAKYTVANRESLLRQAREQLKRTNVFSPIDGIVTLLNSKLGERVVGSIQMQGTEVIRIADLNQMEAQMDVNENDIVKVDIGDTALVYVDAFPKQAFKGIVRQIANVAETENQDTREQVTNFLVKIRLLKKEKYKLKTGMSASIDIQTQTMRNALSVPIQSVTARPFNEKKIEGIEDFYDKGEKMKTIRVVFVQKDDLVRMYPVQTGISDNTYIHIKKGLDENMKVVSGSYKSLSKELKDSSRVTEKKGLEPKK